MRMSLDGTLEELDFDDDKKETCVDTELEEFFGSSLGEVLLANSNPKNSKTVSEIESIEAIPSTAGEVKTESCLEEIEEGEAIDSIDYGDVEDGEIGGLPDSEFLTKYSCRFFQKGKCGWGKGCRFFHLSDKGLYSMFDEPVMNKDIACHMNQTQDADSFGYIPPPTEALCGWDKALIEVKELIKQSKAKKEENCFEEKKLYMTIENNGVPVNKFVKIWKAKPQRESIQKRLVRQISPDVSNKAERSKNELENDNLKSLRTDCITNSSYHSEWRDPWRRSKTPPKRMRLPSNSSKSSRHSCDSPSTPESSNKCQSRNPKRVHKHKSHKSRSKSFRYNRRARKKSAHRSSSSSSKTSSHSESPADFVRRRSRKRRTPSRSHISRRSKRKKSVSRKKAPSRRRHSSSSSRVVIPFFSSRKNSWERAVSLRKQSRSVSRSLSPLQPSRLTRSVEKKNSDHTPEKLQSSLSRSSSTSHLSDTKPETVRNSCKLSCSDMSISPLSDSSTQLQRSAIECTPFHSEELIPDTSIGAPNTFNLPVPENVSHSKQGNSRGGTNTVFKSSSVSKTKTKKTLNALEMELKRYRTDSRPVLQRARVPRAYLKSRVMDNPLSKDNIAKSPSSAKKKVSTPSTTSKREMLLKQLRCVEEAIARKKQCFKY